MSDDILEIFLITYNRRDYLEVTLNKIFSENSPLKKYTINILDNNSNDGTDILCKKFAGEYSNLNYIKNKKNVGLAGNICKAMEYAQKKYFWILCDNDELDFTAWDEVEQAMQEDNDLIILCRDYYEDEKKCFEAFVLNQLTFLPGGIYKTEHLSDNVMSYTVSDTHTVLPHLPLGCVIINKKGKIKLVSKSIVTCTSNIKIDNIKNYDFDRIKKDNYINKNERIKSINFPTGIIASFDACQNKKIRETAIANFARVLKTGHGPFYTVFSVYMSTSPKYIKQEFFEKIPLPMKIHYWLLRLIKPFLYIVFLYKTPNGINICLFNTFKIRIWSQNWLKMFVLCDKQNI